MIIAPMGFSESIFKILRQFKRPLSLDEISFRSRSPEYAIRDLLSRLTLANMITEEGDKYLLNRDRSQYDLAKLIDSTDQ